MATLAYTGKEISTEQTLTFTTSDTEKTADLGAPYEYVKVAATAAEAANLAGASTLTLMIDDEEYHNELGDLVLVDKPGAGVGINWVVPVRYARNIKVKLSAVPSAEADIQVQGINRLTKQTSEQLYRRTL